MELEEAIKILKETKVMDICTTNYDLYLNNYKQAIETVLQALEELQEQKEKSRIIGNIYGIKIEDLEPVLKPYYIPKKKIKDKIKEYFEYDRKHKTYTKDGRENFTIEYYKAKTLQELLEDK